MLKNDLATRALPQYHQVIIIIYFILKKLVTSFRCSMSEKLLSPSDRCSFVTKVFFSFPTEKAARWSLVGPGPPINPYLYRSCCIKIKKITIVFSFLFLSGFYLKKVIQIPIFTDF